MRRFRTYGAPYGAEERKNFVPGFSVKKPLTVYVVALAILVLGVVAYLKMTPDLMPNMDYPYVIVVTSDPGASPESIEEEITKPLEKSLATLDQLKNITSTSQNSVSMVVLEFENGANMDSLGIDIQQQISALEGQWSDTVSSPYILKVNPSMIPVMVAAISSDTMDVGELSDFVDEELTAKLTRITGVASVDIAGTVDREMHVVLDAEMIRKLPRKIAAATGIDAMAHAIECFPSNKANPFSDIFALEAFDLIMNNIETACDDPDAMEAKNRMQIAAFYAGVAITCSGTTAVHALSYPLGGKYHIAHGVSNAILLVPVMKFNEPVIRGKLAAAYDRIVHGEKTCTTEAEKSAWVVERMGQIVRHLDIPTSLSEFNVPREDLEGLVKAGMQVQRLLVNNMRTVTPEDARNIYLEIM